MAIFQLVTSAACAFFLFSVLSLWESGKAHKSIQMPWSLCKHVLFQFLLPLSVLLLFACIKWQEAHGLHTSSPVFPAHLVLIGLFSCSWLASLILNGKWFPQMHRYPVHALRILAILVSLTGLYLEWFTLSF